MMKRVLPLAIFAAVFALDASAAQRATVEEDGTPLLRGPMPKAEVVGQLKKGTALNISNNPVEGYYKIKTVDNEIGWVKATSLILESKKQSPQSVPAIEPDRPRASKNAKASTAPSGPAKLETAP